MNLSARYGGGRFLSVVSTPEISGALIFADRVRGEFALAQPRHGPMSVGAGLAANDPGMASVHELLAAAEHRLFLAKAAGRDSVRVGDRSFLIDTQSIERGYQ